MLVVLCRVPRAWEYTRVTHCLTPKQLKLWWPEKTVQEFGAQACQGNLPSPVLVFL